MRELRRSLVTYMKTSKPSIYVTNQKEVHKKHTISTFYFMFSGILSLEVDMLNNLPRKKLILFCPT